MRVFTVESERERNLASSFLLASPKASLAAFSMHGFNNVYPILRGFFVNTIKRLILNDASTTSTDEYFQNASLLSIFILLNDSSLASKNSKLSCRPGCFARQWRCKRLGLEALLLKFSRLILHFQTTCPLSMASLKSNRRKSLSYFFQLILWQCKLVNLNFTMNLSYVIAYHTRLTPCIHTLFVSLHSYHQNDSCAFHYDGLFRITNLSRS